MDYFTLQSLNFSTAEQALFEAFKKEKMAKNTSQIARRAGIPRTTAIYILRKFEKRGLIRKAERGKRNFWILKTQAR